MSEASAGTGAQEHALHRTRARAARRGSIVLLPVICTFTGDWSVCLVSSELRALLSFLHTHVMTFCDYDTDPQRQTSPVIIVRSRVAANSLLPSLHARHTEPQYARPHARQNEQRRPAERRCHIGSSRDRSVTFCGCFLARSLIVVVILWPWFTARVCHGDLYSPSPVLSQCVVHVLRSVCAGSSSGGGGSLRALHRRRSTVCHMCKTFGSRRIECPSHAYVR